MQAHEDTPFVSVVVPVYNDEGRIATCVEALLAQTYPRDRYEVIVVDNGSTDGSYAAVKPYPVKLLSETQTQGSFAARNLGLREARGTIFAFTDSDCTPSPQWLAEGVAAIKDGADLVGGHVRFVFSSRPSGAEICDSVANMQMERNIRERGVAKTANLFATEAVLRGIGPFPHDLRSGGDVIWTRRATSAGFKLVYSPTAEVAHPTRRLVALLKKQYRVGHGQRAIRAAERARNGEARGGANGGGGGRLRKLKRTLRGFLPEPMASVRSSLRQSQSQLHGPVTLFRVWVAAWLCRAATTLGNLSAARAGKERGRPGYATE